jgi:hypothetical protein
LKLVQHALPRLAATISALAPATRHVDIHALRRLLLGADSPALSVAFLKQFRDSQLGSQACHQEVFQAPASLGRPKLEHLGRGRLVEIGNFASHPIADELGLSPAARASGVYESALTFRMEFDLHMGMQPTSQPSVRKKVAILGGGPAGLAAMMDLSKYPEQFELTLYQLGWRLGGKCASSRGFSSELATGAESSTGEWQRNQEHGLHMALGFYENFFDLLRQAYDNLNRSDEWALRTWRDAVTPRLSYTLAERPWPGRGAWLDLGTQLPTNDLLPGDRARHADASAGRPYLLDAILSFVKSLLGVAAQVPTRKLASVRHKLDLGVLREALQALYDKGASWIDDPARHVTELQQALHAQLRPFHEQSTDRGVWEKRRDFRISSGDLAFGELSSPLRWPHAAP